MLRAPCQCTIAGHMGRFRSAREAKEFLVARIVDEAKLESVSLSEIERKMLYFSETYWTLPDIMHVNEEFDREYDQDEYEKKITHLVIKASAHDRKESRDKYDAWLEAIRLLEKEDHYILVMVQAAEMRPRGDQFKLFIAGLSIAAVLVSYPFLSTFLSQKYGSTLGKYSPSVEGRIFYLTVIGLFAVGAYLLGWLNIGKPKI
jgi:hypothetical protein